MHAHAYYLPKLRSLNTKVRAIPTILSPLRMSFSSSSTFCEKCRAVLFDDSAVEGYVAQGADDGQEFLRIKGCYYERCFDKKIMPANYDVEDSYPDLIFLSTSAAAGCKFCDFLRTMALEPKLQKKSSEAGIDITRADKVQIRMQYLWKVDPLETPTANGLCALQLVFCFNAGLSRHDLFRRFQQAVQLPLSNYLSLALVVDEYLFTFSIESTQGMRLLKNQMQ